MSACWPSPTPKPWATPVWWCAIPTAPTRAPTTRAPTAARRGCDAAAQSVMPRECGTSSNHRQCGLFSRCCWSDAAATGSPAFAGDDIDGFLAPRRAASRFAEAVERLRVLHQDAVAGGLVGRPLRDQVEQHGVVGLVGFVRVRPVRAPHHPLRRGLDVGRPDLVDVGIAGRAVLAA